MSRTYTTVKGDTLFKIAIRFYGDGNKYPIISQANPVIKNPDIIIPGLNLVIPDLPERL